MTDFSRPRVLRAGTVLSTVLTTVLGLCAAVLVGAPGPAATPSAPALAPVNYTDGNPMGGLNTMARTQGGLHAVGWTFDPDQRTVPNTVWAWVDGKPVQPTVVADLARPDVAHYYPSAGPSHGFDLKVLVPEGTHTVCIRAGNLGRGGNDTLGCRTALFNYSPIGTFDSVTAASGALHVSGWALDGDMPQQPLTVTISIDGAQYATEAGLYRPDVAAKHPGTGMMHGFDRVVPVAQGTHQVCVTAGNVGYGKNTTLGCKTITLNESPRGGINVPQQTNGRMKVWGWAFDPDAPTAHSKVLVTVDGGHAQTLTASLSRVDVAKVYPSAGRYHGWSATLTLPEGSHTVCATVYNVGFGHDVALACRTGVLNFTPTAALASLTATSTGAALSGWATDPDTTAAIRTIITADGRPVLTLLANGAAASHTGHAFSSTLHLTSGRHTVCAVAVNALYGTHNSAASCRTVTLSLKPLGNFEAIGRVPGSNALTVNGWAFDPDTTAPISVLTTIDGHASSTVVADVARRDVDSAYALGTADHGFSGTLPSDAGEHTVCLTARNVGGGSNTDLGCKLVNAVNPVVPSAPGSATAQVTYGAATVTWTPPASDGGAPWTKYIVTTYPGGTATTVAANATSATIGGLKGGTTYSFSVVAVNVAGASVAAITPTVTPPAGPPAQTTPAPVSTSRYTRNLSSATATDLSKMRAEGAADAAANPSGHGYLILLDIGGQDEYDGGVALTATAHYVSYGNLVKDLKAYVDGYHSKQKASAPITIALGTNNDMDVSTSSGRSWATHVVNPLVAYAKQYANMSIAGADDIEPGFTASYSASKAWVSGYLSAATAPFVFNGSADGCAWSYTGSRCNNGWTMAGLQYVSGGISSSRVLGLPQIYNTTMAAQWKWISLTGVVSGLKRINFAGVLTEWTACSQAGGCGSMTGRSAWSSMWSNLQSDSRLKVGTLPYATDLRIDR